MDLDSSDDDAMTAVVSVCPAHLVHLSPLLMQMSGGGENWSPSPSTDPPHFVRQRPGIRLIQNEEFRANFAHMAPVKIVTKDRDVIAVNTHGCALRIHAEPLPIDIDAMIAAGWTVETLSFDLFDEITGHVVADPDEWQRYIAFVESTCITNALVPIHGSFQANPLDFVNSHMLSVACPSDGSKKRKGRDGSSDEDERMDLDKESKGARVSRDGACVRASD